MVKQKRKNLFLVLGSISIVILSFLLFFSGEDSSVGPAYGPGENMDRDFALELGWTTEKASFKFSRANVNDDWSPQVNNKDIRSIIWALPFNNIEAVELPRGKRITVELKFARKDEKWVGAWSKGIFVWQEGPLKGTGRVLSQEQNQLFEAGQFVFSDRKIDWCKSRIKKITNWNQQVWEFVKGEWLFTQENSEVVKGKGQFLESWMSSNCRILVDQFVDPNMVSPNMLLANKVQVSFEKALPSNFSLHETGVFKLNEIYFRSTSFENAVKDLAVKDLGKH